MADTRGRTQRASRSGGRRGRRSGSARTVAVKRAAPAEREPVVLPAVLSVSELADKLEMSGIEVIRELMKLGRKAVTEIVRTKKKAIKITVKNHSFASSNSSSQIKIVDDNGMLYAGGTYSFGYELYLNRGFYGGYRSIKDIARDHGDTNYDDFDNIYYSPLSGYDFIGVDYKILAANRTNTGVIWETNNKSIATIDKDTGVLTAHRTGDVWIRALPSTAGGKSAVLHKGAEIERAGEDTENWYGVLYNGKQRYVSRKYTEEGK